MSSRITWLMLGALLAPLLSGCERQPAAPKEIATQAKDQGQAPTPTAKEADAPPDAQRPPAPSAQLKGKVSQDRAKGKALAKQYRTLLRKGREQVQAKSYKEGIETFIEALKLDPNDSRVLSELGFAALLDGQLERAQRATLDSLRFAQDSKLKGAALYNLGRIAEAKDDKEGAASYYTRSLEIRPDNKIVTQRLAALKVDAPTAAPASSACGFDIITPTDAKAPLKSLCQVYVKDGLVDPSGAHECDAPSGFKTLKLDGDRQAVIFSYEERDIFTRFYVLALYDGAQWSARQLDMEYNPGAFGIGEELQIDQLEGRQLIPGGAQELLLRWSHRRHDSDMGINEYEESERHQTLVLIFDQLSPFGMILLEESASYSRDFIFPREEEEAGIEHSIQSPTQEATGVKVIFHEDSGELELVAKDKLGPGAGIRLGRKPLKDYAQLCTR